jgi:hypothetical protein
MVLKQTASNNSALSYIKKHMNAAIYKKVATLINAGDTEGAKVYYGSFFRDEIRAARVDEAFGQDLIAQFEAICAREGVCETLQWQHMDRLDFHEVSVGDLTRLMCAAYTLGKNTAK